MLALDQITQLHPLVDVAVTVDVQQQAIAVLFHHRIAGFLGAIMKTMPRRLRRRLSLRGFFDVTVGIEPRTMQAGKNRMRFATVE